MAKKSEPRKLIGSLSEYVPGDNFQEYLEKVDNFFVMNQIKNGDFKKKLFIHFIGSKTYTQLIKLIAPNTVAEMNLGTIIIKLKDYYTNTKSVIVQHFIFNKRDQHLGESIQDYAVELQSLANYCEFGVFRDSALKDRFLVGLRSTELQDNLLDKWTKEEQWKWISFMDAVLIARHMELTKVDIQATRKSVHNLGLVNKVNTSILLKRDKPPNDKTQSRSFGRDEVTSNGDDETDEVNQMNCNKYSNNIRIPYHNGAARPISNEPNKDSGRKKQYTRPRYDLDMNNRIDTHNANQNRNFEKDYSNSDYITLNNIYEYQNDRFDYDKNYASDIERLDGKPRSSSIQNTNNKSNPKNRHNHIQHCDGHLNNHNFNSHAVKKNDSKVRNYIPLKPSENEDELFASGITSGVNFIKFDEIPVNVSGEDIPPTIDAFENSGLTDFVVQNIKRSGYSHPTPIQKNAIPIILAGRDIMACAQTGSGKTAAFLLPIISKLLSEERQLSSNKPHVLVVSLTRELGIQIEAECRKFAMKSCLKTLHLYGGTASGYQMDKANKGCHLLIATPDSLLDFVTRGIVSFGDLRFIVLDEADGMPDMGFLPAIEKLMQHSSMPPPDKRQTLMFSTTFPKEIQRLAGKLLNTYLFVAVGIVGGASADVEQCVFQVSKFEKRKKLMEIIEKEEPDGIMVFVETKRNADFLASFLSEKQVLTTSMHGDRYQRQLEEALNDFKSGRMKVLITTSVGARGFDIKNVRHVINFDLPKLIDEYVHRIGRTGRVGNCGKVTSFFDADDDYAIAGDLKKILHQTGQKVPRFLDIDVSSSKHHTNNKRSNFGGKDVRKGQYHRKQDRVE